MALKPLHVEMTEADLREGTPGVAIGDPVGLAVERAGRARGFRGAVEPGGLKLAYAWVCGLVIYVGRYKAHTPPAVADFIRRLDAKLPVKPIAFDLELEDA